MLLDPNRSVTVDWKSPLCAFSDCSTSTLEKVATFPDAMVTSGGGFSTYMERMSYQEDAVSAYLNSGVPLPRSKDFNPKNRGFPDVSAIGHNYVTVQNGFYYLVDGTSASTPLWAGIITRWNAYRMSKGLPSLGFINPLIYQMYADNPSSFIDITLGDNFCSETCCALEGYWAAPGWDAVSGLGTPNYSKMWQYITSLPS